MKKLFAILPLAALMFACGNPRPVEVVEPAAEVVYEEVVVEEVEAVAAPTTPAAAPAPRPATPATPTAPAPTPEPKTEPESERIVVEIEEGQEAVGTRGATRRQRD